MAFIPLGGLERALRRPSSISPVARLSGMRSLCGGPRERHPWPVDVVMCSAPASRALVPVRLVETLRKPERKAAKGELPASGAFRLFRPAVHGRLQPVEAVLDSVDALLKGEQLRL